VPRKRSPGPVAKPKPAGGIDWRIHFALAALVLIAWSDSFGLGLARDGGAVTSDVRIQAASAQNVGLILTKDYWWPNPADRLYRPVTTLTYLLNYSVLGEGENAAGYHALNLLLHLINVWLVFALALLLLRERVPAFCAAALWAVHPITTESVTNVAGRADLLASMAVLSGLLLYVRVRETLGVTRWLAAIALFVIAGIGVFCKENGAVLLGLVFLWDICFNLGGRKSMLRQWPLYASVAASLILMWLVRWRVFASEPWPAGEFLDNPLTGAGFWAARFTAVKVLGMEFWLLVFPLRLSSDYSYNAIPISTAVDLRAWAALIAILAVVAVAVMRYRKNDRLPFWCAGFAALTLLPTSNLIVIRATMAERFLYLPSIGFAIAVAALAFRLKERRLTVALLSAIIVLFAARTWLRNMDWNNDLTIATADLKVAPGSFRLHELRAGKLFAESPDGNIDKTIREGEAAWAILRDVPPVDSDPRTPASLGVYYRKKGDVAEAAASPDKAAEAGRIWYQKSLEVLLRAQDISRAREKAFDEAQIAHGLPLAYRLGDDVLYFNLAATYLELGKLPEAMDALHYERVLNPTSPDSYEAMARVYIKQTDFSSAAVALDERAIVSGPTADIVSALRDAYSRLPEGSCAFKSDGEGLNPGCPGVLKNRCRALSELKAVFTDARVPEMALHFSGLADQQGCDSVSAKQ
jgi:tetratricopeptide (TPR) repeat protein